MMSFWRRRSSGVRLTRRVIAEAVELDGHPLLLECDVQLHGATVRQPDRQVHREADDAGLVSSRTPSRSRSECARSPVRSSRLRMVVVPHVPRLRSNASELGARDLTLAACCDRSAVLRDRVGPVPAPPRPAARQRLAEDLTSRCVTTSYGSTHRRSRLTPATGGSAASVVSTWNSHRRGGSDTRSHHQAAPTPVSTPLSTHRAAARSALLRRQAGTTGGSVDPWIDTDPVAESSR